MKVFNKKTTLNGLKNDIKCFAKSKGVYRVICNKRATYILGSYSTKTKVIYLSSKQTKKQMLVTFFHELAHFTACKKGWWKKYHTQIVKDSVNAFFVENSIDRLAKQLWSTHVDTKIWGKYVFAYYVKDKRQHLEFFNFYYNIN